LALAASVRPPAPVAPYALPPSSPATTSLQNAMLAVTHVHAAAPVPAPLLNATNAVEPAVHHPHALRCWSMLGPCRGRGSSLPSWLPYPPPTKLDLIPVPRHGRAQDDFLNTPSAWVHLRCCCPRRRSFQAVHPRYTYSPTRPPSPSIASPEYPGRYMVLFPVLSPFCDTLVRALPSEYHVEENLMHL